VAPIALACRADHFCGCTDAEVRVLAWFHHPDKDELRDVPHEAGVQVERVVRGGHSPPEGNGAGQYPEQGGAMQFQCQSLVLTKIVAIAGMLTLLAVPSARGLDLFWTNANASAIGASNFDGTSANQGLITGTSSPIGIAVQGNNVYWSNYDSTEQKYWFAIANLDGTGVTQDYEEIASYKPNDITVSGNFLFWSNANNVGRIDLTGANAYNPFWINASGTIYGIAVSGNTLYWDSSSLSGNNISTANLGGSGGHSNLIQGLSSPGSLAVDASYIYWGNGTSIGRANLDGTGVNQDFITGLTGAFGVAVNAGYVYWGSQSSTGPSEIGRANLDGTDVNPDFITVEGSTSIPYLAAVSSVPEPTTSLLVSGGLVAIAGLARKRTWFHSPAAADQLDFPVSAPRGGHGSPHFASPTPTISVRKGSGGVACS
jgi:hypothetical protein